MTQMFYGASKFNQDLSAWVVNSIDINNNHDHFSTYSSLQESYKPHFTH